ncbi:DoxX family protein [Gordonia sp. ABSL1-1]|uniref:DoxX family protein n=1 Tax=Gordonia sp. ABSL1-1 TaxID=3053923 RepID=UPI00257487DE|nr:DoxX family protein [Gordonia sp. ABSL1-1]MDL9938194.1 DoxX family protein [Gordonia sp. ABSL1-1]
MILRRIARPMLASVFVASGIDALRNPAPKADIAQGFVDSSAAVLSDEVRAKVPTDPEVLVRINGAIQVGSGVLLATGKYPRAAAAVLAGSLVPTTVAGHPFWAEQDPARRVQQRTQFLKNLSLLGGLLITAADTEGKPSLAWRGRRKAVEVGHAVADALPSSDAPTAAQRYGSQVGDLLHQGADRVSEQSEQAAALVREHGPELAQAARERSAELADAARLRAPELAEGARHLAETAAHRAAAAAHRADDSRRRWGNAARREIRARS